MHRELTRGTLSPTQHYSIDMDVAKLYEIVTNCERLFSSPIPPNMARHGMRSLVLQMGLLPVVLAGTMPPLAVAATVAVTSYIYVGIDELGVQVGWPVHLPEATVCTQHTQHTHNTHTTHTHTNTHMHMHMHTHARARAYSLSLSLTCVYTRAHMHVHVHGRWSSRSRCCRCGSCATSCSSISRRRSRRPSCRCRQKRLPCLRAYTHLPTHLLTCLAARLPTDVRTCCRCRWCARGRRTRRRRTVSSWMTTLSYSTTGPTSTDPRRRSRPYGRAAPTVPECFAPGQRRAPPPRAAPCANAPFATICLPRLTSPQASLEASSKPRASVCYAL